MNKAHGLLADRDVEYLLLESDNENDESDDEDEETIDVTQSAELNIKYNNEEWKWSKNRSVTNFEFTASPGVKSTVLRKLGCAPSEVDFFTIL